MEVIIDGIKYIPAKETTANINDFAKALLIECIGVCDDNEVNKCLMDDSVYVSVNDWNEGVPLRKILDNICEISKG